MTLIYLALAWAVGIVACHALWTQGLLGCAAPGWPLGALAGVAGLGAILLRRRPALRLVLAMLLMALLGGWRYHSHPLAACVTPADLSYYHRDEADGPVRATIEGVIVGYPEVGDTRASYRLRAEVLAVAGKVIPVRGNVLVQAPRFPGFAYGDRLRATGDLQTPPRLDDFDYRAYLARQGIHSQMRQAQLGREAQGQGKPFWSALYGLRARGSALLNRILPEPAASLANGMLLGIESGIPANVANAFQVAGVTHVIVISGSNIALLSGMLLGVWGRLIGKRWAAAPAVAVIAFYVLLVGAEPPALRAGLMGILYVLAIALGRENTALISLFASGLLMTAWDPLALWDIGFQLSFAATLGLILFAPPIEARLERFLQGRLPEKPARRAIGLLNQTLIVTLAAQITALPLIVYYFGRLSLLAPLTNALILPVQPPILVGGMVALCGGLIWEPLGRILAVIPWLFLTFTTTVVRLAAAVPIASMVTGEAGRAPALAYYAILAALLCLRRFLAMGRARLSVPRAATWAGLVILPVWLGVNAIAALPDGKLHIHYLEANGGEAVLLTSPVGQRVWIWDGRADGSALIEKARPLLGRWRKGVDLWIAPSTGAPGPGTLIADPRDLAPGATISLSGGLSLTRLYAGDGWALLLGYRKFSTLLPAALTPSAQAELAEGGSHETLNTTVLKCPGPDTRSWPTVALLEWASPQVTLWPEGTTYPPDVATTLGYLAAIRLATEAQPEVVTDGERVWVRQWARSPR